MSEQQEGGRQRHDSESAVTGQSEVSKKKHWWQENPIRRLSFQRNRSASESSECAGVTVPPPDSATKTTPPSGKKGRSFSVSDSIEKHVEKRERWSKQYDVPSELFIPPWF